MGEGKGGMIWENGIETYILSYVKQIASPGSMLKAGALGWPREMVWWGRWEGVQDGEHMYTRGRFMSMYDKPPQYCKVISLQLKI